jgi:hypothetical protein
LPKTFGFLRFCANLRIARGFLITLTIFGLGVPSLRVNAGESGALSDAKASKHKPALDLQVLAVGGANGQQGPYGSGAGPTDADIYDSVTGQFLPAVPVGPQNPQTATTLANGQVLLTIGDTASAELYDPKHASIKTTGSLRQPRISDYQATLLNNGRVLVTGGKDVSGNPILTADLYNPRTHRFTDGGTSNLSEMDTATLLQNGQVLVTDGATSNAELYNSKRRTFTPTGSMAEVHASIFLRAGYTATLLRNGRVLIAGGVQNFGNTNEAELYDPSSGTFTPTGSMKGNRWFHTATLLQDGTVLMAGSCGYQNVLFDTAELYDPGTGQFTPTARLLTENRCYHSATLLPNGQVLIAGGWDYIQPPVGFIITEIATAELYDPSTQTFSATASMTSPRAGAAAALIKAGRKP